MTTATVDGALIEAARAIPSGWARVTTRGKARKPPHIDLLDRKLCDLEARRIQMLIVEMPPRHGKSFTCTEKFPGWYLGRNPDHRVGIVGYSANLAERFGGKNRGDMEEYGPRVFSTRVDPRSSAKDDWELAGHEGGMIAVGVKGSITGRGLDLLVIDDPIKNHIEAESEAYRGNLWELWSSTLLPRLEPNAVVMVIQTRWHMDDLAGKLQADPPEGWTVDVVRLPALAEEPSEQYPQPDLLGRKPGEPLWEARYPAKVLHSRRKGNSYVWNALYQQRPTAAEGNLLKRDWWARYDGKPQTLEQRLGGFDQVIQSWDCAFKDTNSSSYVVGQVWARKGAEFFLLDQTRDRMNFPETLAAIRDTTAAWPTAKTKLVEEKANGAAVISTLRRQVPGLTPVEPEGGKVARVVAISHLVESHSVHLPTQANAGWVGEFISECADFPNAPNDDQVDAMSQALVRLERSVPQATSEDSTPDAADPYDAPPGSDMEWIERRRRQLDGDDDGDWG